MPGQLLPLRLLGGSSALLASSRGMSILSMAFPFKLRYSGLCPRHPPRVYSSGVGVAGVRTFSGRSAAPRGGGLRDNRRGGFRAAGQGKSLVEDEAEVSDWISELKTDSFRVGIGGEGDDAGGFVGGKSKSRERGRGGDGDRARARVGRDSFRRGLGSESDDADSYTRSRSNRRESGRGRDGDMPRTRNRSERGRGALPSRRGYGMPSVRERGGKSADFNSMFERRQTRDPVRSLRDSRGLPPRKKPIDSDLDEEENERDFASPKRDRRGNGGMPSSAPLEKGGKMYSDSRGLRSRKKPIDSDLDEEEGEVDFRSLKRDRRGNGSMPSSPSLAKRGKMYSNSMASSSSLGGGGRLSFEISDEEENVDDDEADLSGSEEDFLSRVENQEDIVVQDACDSKSSAQEQGDAPTTPSTSKGADSYLSQTRFDQCSLSPLSLKGIKAAGYERMTMVQEATLPVILKGKDVLAKAKTGTGKTVAFLLPAIEVITKLPSVDRDERRAPINVLVMCPTRELANQAAMEATKLLKFHPSIGVQVVIGGTRLALEQKNMQANPCQILVATPGRLRDHIENTPGFATRLRGVKVLVLDEADHLLDMGFRKDIENIVAAVPNQRQTLLFSATVSDEVRQVCHIALKRDHEFLNTVEEGSEETHSQVKQLLVVAPLEKHFSMLYGILTDHISENVDYKVLVFCTTAMVTKLVADLLSELNLNVREIHSRKPQSYRTRVSDEFRKSKGLILVTSDVSARGVDYPDVTLVMQVGVPADREQYIHRLGRTGRTGKEGKGLLLLAPWEEFFLASIKDLPISKASLPLIDPETRKKVERALSHVEMKNKESAYQSWLGYYNSNKNIGRDKGRLVLLANEFSRSMGLDNPPAIPKLVLGKMGLRNVPGLRTK